MPLREFARLPRAEASPGRCVRCPRNEDLIDFGAEQIPGYGVVYLCTVCFGDLIGQMKLVPYAQLEQTILAADQREAELHARLADAEARAGAPIEHVSHHLEVFANVLDSAARDLVRGLGSVPAGSGPVPAPAAEPVEPRADELPVEPAVDEPRDDEAAGPVDAGASILAALGIPGAVAGVPADADAGRDAGGDEGALGDDPLALLYDAPAE